MLAPEETDDSLPMWAAFGDLMACLFGLFVLFFAWVVTFDVVLVRDLEQERAQHEAAVDRLDRLQRALAGPLGRGTVTLVEGRIGIRGSVLFRRNSAQLSAKGDLLVEELSAPLATYLEEQDQALMVSGFTDDLRLHGQRQFADNWELSSQRALTVVRALVDAGLPPGRLFAAGFGASHPIVPNQDERSRSQNRRVELSPVPMPTQSRHVPARRDPPASEHVEHADLGTERATPEPAQVASRRAGRPRSDRVAQGPVTP